jgi:hypothetical protein
LTYSEAIRWRKLSTSGSDPSSRQHKKGYDIETDEEGDVFVMRRWQNGQTDRIYASGLEEIKREVPRKLQGEERKGYITQKTAGLETEQQPLDEEYKQSPGGKLQAGKCPTG